MDKPSLPKIPVEGERSTSPSLLSVRREANLINASKSMLTEFENLRLNLLDILSFNPQTSKPIQKPSALKEASPTIVSKKPLSILEEASKDFLKFALLAIAVLNENVRKTVASFFAGFLRGLGAPELVISGVRYAIENLDKVLLAYFGFKALKRVWEFMSALLSLNKMIMTLFEVAAINSSDSDSRISLLDAENKKLRKSLKRSKDINRALYRRNKEREAWIKKYKQLNRRTIITLNDACKKRTERLKRRLETQQQRVNSKTNVITKSKEKITTLSSRIKTLVITSREIISKILTSLKNTKKVVEHVKGFFRFLRGGMRVFRLGLLIPAAAVAIPTLGMSILVAYGVGTLVDALIGSVVDYALDTEKKPDDNIFKTVSEIFVRNIISSATFGIVDQIPGWVKKMLGFEPKEGEAKKQSKLTKKQENDYAFSILIGKNTIEQVPPESRKAVLNIMSNPPAHWSKHIEKYEKNKNLINTNSSHELVENQSSDYLTQLNTLDNSVESNNNLYSNSIYTAKPNLAYEVPEQVTQPTLVSPKNDIVSSQPMSISETRQLRAEPAEPSKLAVADQVKDMSENKVVGVKNAQKNLNNQILVLNTFNTNVGMDPETSYPSNTSRHFSTSVGF